MEGPVRPLRLAIPGAVLCCLLTLQSAGSQQAPWFGTWRLDMAKSPEQASRYKRVTARIEPWQDGLKVIYDMVGLRGGVTHTEWTGRFDGKDYPMQGVDTAMTNAYRQIDDRSYEIVLKLDGHVAATARVAVSPDGQTLTVVTTNSNGKTPPSTSVYQKAVRDPATGSSEILR
jgi:hypothetical protein